MFKFRPHIFSTLVLVSSVLLEVSCSRKEEKRPSPLAADSTTIEGVKITIDYSSPGVKKRKIWGELVPYGEIWRTGANKATHLSTSADILVNGQKLEAGKYAIFTIPTDSTWTVLFNSEWDQWGAYNYDPTKDALRLTIHPRKSDYTERMTFSFKEEYLQFEWENLYYRLKLDPI